MSVTLSEVYEQFLSYLEHRRRMRPATLRAYRYELSAASHEGCFQVPLDELNPSDLEQWLMRSPSAPSTVSRRTSTFCGFFEWALENELCIRNPLSKRPHPRTTRRLPRPVRNQTDRSALDIAIASSPQPYRLIFTILRETGMRVGEVLNLRLGDITLDAGREAFRIQEPKNAIERTVVLGPTATPKTLRGLRAYLKTLQETEDYTLIFRSNRGTGISYDAAHYQWKKVCTDANLVDASGKPRYTLHQLRHTRGSELVAEGQPIEIIQRVLGHRDIRSTLGYAELNEQQVRAALEKPRRH